MNYRKWLDTKAEIDYNSWSKQRRASIVFQPARFSFGKLVPGEKYDEECSQCDAFLFVCELICLEVLAYQQTGTAD